MKILKYFLMVISIVVLITSNCDLYIVKKNKNKSTNIHKPPVYNAAKIYWMDYTNKKIKRANLDGTSVEEIITNLTTATTLQLKIDILNDKIYWSDYDTNNMLIRRADLDGTNKETLASTSSSHFGYCLAINTDNNLIYWSSTGTEIIYKSNFLGNVSSLVYAGPSNAGLGAVFYYKKNQRIYWGNFGGSSGNCNKIVNVDLSGSDQKEITIDTSANGNVRGTDRIIVNPNDNKIYYSLTKVLGIKRINLDGTGVETLISGSDSSNICSCFDIDLINNKIYFTDETGNIKRADIDGTNIVTIIPNFYKISDIAVYIK